MKHELFITNKISIRYKQGKQEKIIYLKHNKLKDLINTIKHRSSQDIYYSYIFMSEDGERSEVLCTKDPIMVCKDVI